MWIYPMVVGFLWGWTASGFAQAAPCESEKPSQRVPAIGLELIAENLSKPICITGAKDGTGRLFIAQQDGLVQVIKEGKILTEPFLDLRGSVKIGEKMGLLGMAFHPRYSENQKFYVYYTTQTNRLYTVLSEFNVETASGMTSLRERVLLKIEQPFENNKGGQIEFGPDGNLYIGVGDGGGKDDPKFNAQRLDTWLGKILRISVESKDPGLEYSIPKENPFNISKSTQPTEQMRRSRDKNAKEEIYAYGLRDPWRFSFDTVTYLLYSGDVGHDSWEEINLIGSGKNYGWRIMEGKHCNASLDPKCSEEGLELPVLDYGKDKGTSVTGGYVYRGSQVPGLCGYYVYGDFASGIFRAFYYYPRENRIVRHATFMDTQMRISAFGQDENYELYLTDYEKGRLYKIVPPN